MARRDATKATGRASASTPAHRAPSPPPATRRAAPDGGTSQPTAEDVVFVHSPTESGQGYNVIRHRRDRVEVGELRQLEEGRPVVGELVRLSPRPEHERLFDVEVMLDRAELGAGRAGPPRVSTAAYRDNWETIFGGTAAEHHPPVDEKQLN